MFAAALSSVIAATSCRNIKGGRGLRMADRTYSSCPKQLPTCTDTLQFFHGLPPLEFDARRNPEINNVYPILGGGQLK